MMTKQKTTALPSRADGRQAECGRAARAARAILALGLLFAAGCLKPLPNLPDAVAMLGSLEASRHALPAKVRITGLMGTVDVVVNGTNTVSLSDPGGSADFTRDISVGGSYTVVASQRATFAVDAAKQNWRSQACTVTGGTGTVAVGDPAPAIAIACVNTPTVYDPTNDLTWMRCSQGQTYRPATNDCRGTGDAGDYYGAHAYAYCDPPGPPVPDDSCNDVGGGTEAVTPVTGHLIGSGPGSAFPACDGLNDSGGTHGKANWRLPTMNAAELVHIQETAVPFFDPGLFPDTVANYYWSSSAYSSGNAWVASFGSNTVSAPLKDTYLYVRCMAPGP